MPQMFFLNPNIEVHLSRSSWWHVTHLHFAGLCFFFPSITLLDKMKFWITVISLQQEKPKMCCRTGYGKIHGTFFGGWGECEDRLFFLLLLFSKYMYVNSYWCLYTTHHFDKQYSMLHVGPVMDNDEYTYYNIYPFRYNTVLTLMRQTLYKIHRYRHFLLFPYYFQKSFLLRSLNSGFCGKKKRPNFDKTKEIWDYWNTYCVVLINAVQRASKTLWMFKINWTIISHNIMYALCLFF